MNEGPEYKFTYVSEQSEKWMPEIVKWEQILQMVTFVGDSAKNNQPYEDMSKYIFGKLNSISWSIHDTTH